MTFYPYSPGGVAPAGGEIFFITRLTDPNTPETKQNPLFANAPNVTGLAPHSIIDVRVDDDSDNASRFNGDTLPTSSLSTGERGGGGPEAANRCLVALGSLASRKDPPIQNKKVRWRSW